MISVPPTCAMSMEFPSSAAMTLAPPSMSGKSTSRPCFRKMPWSFAKYGARFAGVMFWYAARTLIGAAGVGATVGAVVAAVVGAAVGLETAAGAPPQLRTIRAIARGTERTAKGDLTRHLLRADGSATGEVS